MKLFFSLLLAALMLLSLTISATAEETEQPAWQADGVLRILGIGNSYTEDTFQFMYDVATALGIEQMEFAYCWIGGSSVEQHVNNIQVEKGAYELCVTTDGSWTSHKNVTIQYAAAFADWDFITIQQQSAAAGQKERYVQVEELAELVHALCPGAVLAWNMTWAYPDDWDEIPRHEEQFTSLYQRDSMIMHQSIASAVQECIVPIELIEIVIPNGTAIMNARQTYMGDKPGSLSRDGSHLSYVRGRYIAAMTAVAAMTGMDIAQIEGHIAQNYMKTEDFARCAVESVKNALANPWSVTPSQYASSAQE